MAIVLVTSFGYEGSGDFAFIKNTGLEILKAYPDEEIILVSQPEGIHIFKEVLKVEHPRIRLLNIQQFNEDVDTKRINIELYIEGPVFNVDMHTDDKLARATLIGPDLLKYKTKHKIKIPKGTPVLLMPEYGRMPKTEADLDALQKELNRQGIDNITVLRSGFSSHLEEKGIYFNAFLTAFDNAKNSRGKLYKSLTSSDSDQKFLGILKGTKTLEETFSQCDVSLEYSKGNCELFLRMHHTWASVRNKDQIIIGIGKNNKKSQLKSYLPSLSKDFDTVSYIHMESGKEEVLYQRGAHRSVHYRFIHVDRLTHHTLLNLMLLSGPVMGATGDGSLAEGLSAKKVIAYECLDYKVNLAKSLSLELQMRHSDFPTIFKEFFHKPSTGTPRQLSQEARLFLQSHSAISTYESRIADFPDHFNLGPSLLGIIKSIKENLDDLGACSSMHAGPSFFKPDAAPPHRRVEKKGMREKKPPRFKRMFPIPNGKERKNIIQSIGKPFKKPSRRLHPISDMRQEFQTISEEEELSPIL